MLNSQLGTLFPQFWLATCSVFSPLPIAITVSNLLFLSGLSSAGVAQLVEHLICNQRVGGSIPSASSTIVRGVRRSNSRHANIKGLVSLDTSPFCVFVYRAPGIFTAGKLLGHSIRVLAFFADGWVSG